MAASVGEFVWWSSNGLARCRHDIDLIYAQPGYGYDCRLFSHTYSHKSPLKVSVDLGWMVSIPVCHQISVLQAAVVSE
jgi:hypothetical protein